MVRLLPLLSLYFFLYSSVSWAQTTTATVLGTVKDSSGAVLIGAEVILHNLDTGFTRHVTTDLLGTYLIAYVSPGSYRLTVESPGFKTVMQDCLVEVGRVTTLDFSLPVGELSEVVEVEASSVQVNRVQNSLEGIVTSQLTRDLPLNGRNFLDLGQLEPGVQMVDGGMIDPTKANAATLSIGGEMGRSTRITVDGLDISDEMVGSTTLNFSPNAVQEYQLSRSSLDVSTGLTGSGAVNIITRSGGNAVHGEGYFFGRSAEGAARVGQQNFPFDREQGGFSLGGPLRRDRLFWFISYEQNNQDSANATEIPDYPRYSGTWPIPFDERMAVARLDWNVTSNLRLFSRFSYNFSNGIASNSLGGYVLAPFSNWNNTNQTAVGLDYSRSQFTHSLRFGFLNFNDYIKDARNQIEGLPQTVDPQGHPIAVYLESGPYIGPHPTPDQAVFQNNYEWRYDGTASVRHHLLRYGVLYNRLPVGGFVSLIGEGPLLGVPYNSDYRALCGEDILCYPAGWGILANGLGFPSERPAMGYPFGGFANNRFHWYLADSWRINSRLNLNFGVRYVYEPGSVNSGIQKPALLNEFMPGLSRPNRIDKNNFAPNLGLAWDLTGNGKWVARIGAGLYYDTNIVGNFLFERANYLPRGIALEETWIPSNTVQDPASGRVIFDFTGNSPDAEITPGVNWVSGCSDPRYQNGACPLGTPGLLDAVYNAWVQYRAASQTATAGFPSGPSRFERTLYLEGAFAPDFQTPYTFQFNVGIQRELRSGLVLSVDYLRHRGLHYPMSRDYNRVGAANTLRVDSALAAIDALHASIGCAPGPAGVDCAIQAGKSIQDYAFLGLGAGWNASPGSPSTYAFPGNDPKFNYISLQEMQGWTTYNALQINLRGTLPDLKQWVRDWTIVASYSLGRLVGTSGDRSLIGFPADNDNPLGFYGPTSLDRTHILSLGSIFQIPGGFKLGSIWRVMSPLSQTALIPNQTGGPDEVFYTDLTGDGTGGDWLPGTNRGSFGRSVTDGKDLNRFIDQYNQTQAEQLTPHGKALVTAGLFTEAQLKALGAVSPPLPRAPDDQVGLDSFISTDIRLSRPFRLKKEAITIEPGIEWFNVFNVANYDLPGNVLGGTLYGSPGSINGTAAAYRPNRAGFGSGSFALGIPRSWQFSVRVNF
jgi:hypothetical protein